jgi:chitodextrinase
MTTDPKDRKPVSFIKGLLRCVALMSSLVALAACDNLDAFEATPVTGTQAPVSLIAAPAGSSSIGLTWSAAPGDTLADDYRLFRDGVAVVTVHGTSHMDAGLTPSTTYAYWVAAIDGGGHLSATSLPALATTLAAGQTDTTPPTAPTSLTAVPASPSTISLNWNPSTDNSGVLGYRVYRGGVEIGQASGTSYADIGLSASTSYTYTVTGFDAAGQNSAPSNPASATTLAAGASDATAPSAPASLTATATSSTSASLSWSASTDDVGVLGYRIYRNGSQVGTSSSTNFSDTGLTPATAYSYTIVAYDAAGNTSGTSPSAIVTTPAGSQPDSQAPTAPAALTAIATSSSSVDLSWSAATDNVAVTGYRILRNGSQVGTTNGGSSFIDVGLTPSTTYTYAVVAHDAANNTSPSSPPASATTQSGGSGDTQAPTAPTGLSATAAGTTTVDLSWSAATDNIGVTGYRVFRNGSQVATTSGSTYTDSGLSPSTVYTYSVVAFDAAGNTSPPSGSATATTQSPPDTQAPTAPTGLSGTATSFSSVALNWSPSSDNVGVTAYRIFRNGVQTGTASGTTFTDTGLTPLTTYTYTVSARDAAGNVSPLSASVNATTLPLVP